MKTHVMIDFETLGQDPDTAVLSLGAVVFNREGIKDRKLWIFDVEEQLRARRSVKLSTIAWWLDQNEKAKTIFAKCQTEGMPMRNFVMDFTSWCPKDPLIWGCGATFDVSIMENILSTMRTPVPWKFWNVRCYRTLKNHYPIEKDMPRKGTAHDALDDAVYQAECVQAFLDRHPEADK